MKAIWWIGGVAVGFFVLLFFSAPVVLRSKKNPDRIEATNNAKQIRYALMEFDAKYGSFPSAATAARVKADTGTPLTLGDGSSNELFRQLLVTELKSEKVFYAKGPGIRKPDDVFRSDRTALARGECGFAYIDGLSSSSNPGWPVVLAPMIRGTTRFDPKPFGEQAVILRVDGSASFMHIDSAGRVMVHGMDLLDPANPLWGGKAPDIKWQE